MLRASFALLAFLCLFSCAAWAQQPKDPEAEAAKVVALLLEKHSIGKWAVDDARAGQLLRRFLAHLDPHKLFFLESDWQEFAKLEKLLDDQLRAGDLSFVDMVHARIQARVKTGHVLTQRALQSEHDFTLDEAWPFPYAGYADDEAALTERWRLRIKGEILFERANGSSPKDSVSFVRERYDSAAAYIRSLQNSDLKADYLDQLCQDCEGEQGYVGLQYYPQDNHSLIRPKYSLRLRLKPIRPGHPCIWAVIPPARVTD